MRSWRLLAAAAICATQALAAQSAPPGSQAVAPDQAQATASPPAPPRLTSIQIDRGPDSPVGFKIRFGPDGKPTDCIITQSSGSTEIDAAACEKRVPKKHYAGTAAPSPGTDALPSRQSVNNIAGLFSSDDYPPDAARAGKQGTSVVRLTLSPAGWPLRCTIVRSSGTVSLDAAACRVIMTRGRFAAAPDGVGERTFERAISWRLPDDSPQPLVDTKFQVRVAIDGSGKVGPCTTVGYPLDAPTRLCANATLYGQFYVLNFKPSAGTLVLEFGLLVGGPEDAMAIGTAPGVRLINKGGQPFTVLADGRIGECGKPIGTGLPPNQTEAICSPSGRIAFMPLPAGAPDRAARQAVQYGAAYFVNDPPPAGGN